MNTGSLDRRARLGRIASLLAVMVLVLAGPASAETDVWEGYLDYAYVYSSADAAALSARLEEYGRESGVSLREYVGRRFERRESPLEERDQRHRATAYLLLYLAEGQSDDLSESVSAARVLEDRLGRHENRYWVHYVLAHHALEKGDAEAFVEQIFALWSGVVSPLETPFETLRTLSLSQAPSAGFASALPYVYENVARIVTLRSQQKRVDRGLDALGAIVRMLHDGRVGAHPDIIPRAASSWQYLDRIVGRLNGPESDGGSLTFTLALFEARKAHDRASGMLGAQGLDDETWHALNQATGAYEAALERAETTQGHAAVFSRALRELGEVYAAKQRLGVDREFETPFTIAKAMQVYRALHYVRDEGWRELGYHGVGRDAYLLSMRGLWEEIQEASLNAAAFYLSRSLATPHRAAGHVRDAARVYGRYLDFFGRYASKQGAEAVPASAYFAAYDAARGYGDAFFVYPGAAPSATEVQLAVERYEQALRLFPFDPDLWPAYRSALDRQGRGNEYLGRVQPIADSVARSRHVANWVDRGARGADRIDTLRRALSDGLAIMYLGYAEGSGIGELEDGLVELRQRRAMSKAQVAKLTSQRDSLRGIAGGRLADGNDAPPAKPAAAAWNGSEAPRLEDVERHLAQASFELSRIEKQVEARTRALPLYRATLEESQLVRELQVERDHTVHELIRRIAHENE